MTPPRQRWLNALAGLISCLLVTLILGSTLAFGGSAWWGFPAITVTATLLGMASLTKAAIERRWSLLRSPLALLGMLALALATLQLVPLPGSLARTLSPKAHAAYAAGLAPNATNREVADDSSKTPATLDRPATLRWIVGGIVGLLVFCVAAHHADRLPRAMVVWGSVSAAFCICSALGIVQLLADSGGLFGAIEPGSGTAWAPSLADLSDTAGATVSLRLAADPKRPRLAWPVSKPDPQFQIASLLGGPGAYLTLAALGLPMTLGLALQGLAPRGSREGLKARLRESNLAGLAILLLIASILGAGLVGYLAGPILAIPFGVGLAIAGYPSTRGTGLRWSAVAFTSVAISVLAGGVVLGDKVGRPAGSPALASAGGWREVRADWASEAGIAKDFPILGTGLGSFGVVWPYYKSVDRTATNAGSGLIQWWVEAGWVGLALPVIAALWCLVRLPSALARVGSADRALAFGLVGSIFATGMLWAIHGPTGLWSVAFSACALGGTCNRWLAGGTDLFVESP